MKRLTCFQELGEMVQPAEDAIVVISNGLSISGEMVGVGGTKHTRDFLIRSLCDAGYPDVEIFSMDLKFSNRGYNFMSISLSSSKAAEAIIRNNPKFLGNKKMMIKPAIFQPKRNMSRPIGNVKIVKSVQNNRFKSQDFQPRLNPNATSFAPRYEGGKVWRK